MTKRLFRQGGRRVGGRDQTTGAPILPTYTVATVPSAAGRGGQIIYVSDGATNKRQAISDNTAWRFPDGAALS